MASQTASHDEESFIVLSTSPTPSLEARCNGYILDGPVEKKDVDNMLNDLSNEAGMAFKATFQLGDCPSPASMMAASTMISHDRSTEDLQKKFGELLDENVLLKEMIKKNNESLKEQYQLIATCQEDMMKTHRMHKEKFDETKTLVEKLRIENKSLKQQLIDSSLNQSVNDKLEKSVSAPDSLRSQGSGKSGLSSTIEFVTSPDDELVNRLTSQLDLVEKQRRQVILENEKLTWQKESLENIVDATSKERDELRDKLNSLELQFSTRENNFIAEINKLKEVVKELEAKIQSLNTSNEDVKKRDAAIKQYETKVAKLQTDLKTAQLRIIELENVKLEYSKSKAEQAESVKAYREQLQEMTARLREAQTVMFQPVRFSISEESNSSSEFASLIGSVKLYDRTLKHVAELLNSITNGTLSCLESCSTSLATLSNGNDNAIAKTAVTNVKTQLDTRHKTVLTHVGQIKGTLSIFEGIFKEYQEVLKKKAVAPQQPAKPDPSVDTLTAALLGRAEELERAQREVSSLRLIVQGMQNEKDYKELLQSQIEVYKTDFEAERDAREKMAADKEVLAADLRGALKKQQQLQDQLEEVRKLNPNIYKAATTKVSKPKTLIGRPVTTVNTQSAAPKPQTSNPGASGNAGTTGATGNMVYTCPKCRSFSSDQYQVMEDHFDFCLDDF